MLTNMRDAFIGQSRSPNIAPFHMLGIVSYCAIVTLSSIFDFKKCFDFEIGVSGHSRSLKVPPFDRLYGFLLVFFSNFVSKMHRFWDIWFQKCLDLENRVRGPSRLLEMSPCDRAHMTSYWRSIVTVAVFRVFSEIFNVEECCDLEIGVKGHSMWLRVVSFDRMCIISY